MSGSGGECVHPFPYRLSSGSCALSQLHFVIVGAAHVISRSNSHVFRRLVSFTVYQVTISWFLMRRLACNDTWTVSMWAPFLQCHSAALLLNGVEVLSDEKTEIELKKEWDLEWYLECNKAPKDLYQKRWDDGFSGIYLLCVNILTQYSPRVLWKKYYTVHF